MFDNGRPGDLSRRDFLKSAGALGAGSVLAGVNFALGDEPEQAPQDAVQVPTRTFGNTGEQAPILALGGTIDTTSHLLLRQAINYGVTYWDTAYSYGGGSSEQGFGDYFAANSDDRAKVFLVTKSYERSAQGLTNQLATSLQRLQTDHVDMFFLHGVNDPDVFNDEIKTWATNAKTAGKIRFFGFSTHENMSACLTKASEIGWVDGIMLTYNFRTLVLDKALGGGLERAVEAAHEAGIGLTAMKTQAKNMQPSDAQAEQTLLDAFTPRGFSIEQAAVKAVWEDERIACVCSSMPNTTVLAANVAAAMDETSLSQAQRDALREFATATSSDYCAACSQCTQTLNGQAPVCDVLRYVMYYKIYGHKHEARELFAALPAQTRRNLTNVDYSAAERRCPQNVPIAQRMREAVELLA